MHSENGSAGQIAPPPVNSSLSAFLNRHRKRIGYLSFVLFLIGSFVLFDYESRKHPAQNGDAWEYWYQAESFHRHGTPELWPVDMQTVNEEVARLVLGEPPPDPYAYAPTPKGEWYGVHFWAYGLCGALTQEYQVLTGRTPLANLVLANVCLYCLALAVTLFGSNAPIRERIAMVCFAAVGPIFWYVEWTGAEIFSWSLTLISVVAYRDRRYGVAGLSAGLAATQNPTIIFMGAIAVLQAARERNLRSAVLAIAGTAVGLIPYVFFYYYFGKPNLIATEFATLNNISWLRTWSLIGDFNQGLLPYVPVVVIGLVFGFVRMVMLGNIRGLLLAAGGLAMAVGTQVAPNWNSGCEGLQRYLVWMLPVAAGVAVEGIGGTWRMWAFAIAAAISNVAIFFAFNETKALERGYLSNTPVAEWVLNHHPRAYLAEPEVFIERQRHMDNWPMTPADFPVAYARPDGRITKMILDSKSVERVAELFETDPEFMVSLREEATNRKGPFYSHPGGAVRLRK